MSTVQPTHRVTLLPWNISEDEEERFRRILRRVLIAYLLISLLVPWLPVPKPDRAKDEELPPRFAKLLLEHQAPPPPPVVKQPEPEVKRPEARKPEVKRTGAPKKSTVDAARAKAERSGLLAIRDELSALQSISTSRLAKTELAKGPVPAAGPSGPGPQRSIITSNAAHGSGGINTSRLSRDTGGGGLGSRSTGHVSSPVGGGGRGDAQLTRGGGGKASRSLEEIRLVFDRNKGAIYALYNRALRTDPSLQGKVVLKLTIAPSGQVLDCRIVSSELHAPDLEHKLTLRVRQFSFGTKSVETMIVTYPIDFLPS